jgi:hypothetical protein
MPEDFRETLALAMKRESIKSTQLELVSPYQYESILREIVKRFTILDLRYGLELT